MRRFHIVWLMFSAAFMAAGGESKAARVLVRELLDRPPAAAAAPAMSALALEACFTRAQALDRTGVAVDEQVAAVDRLAAQDRLLKNQIRAEIGAVNGYDEAGLIAFQQRVIRQSEVSKKFEADFALYRARQKEYDNALAAFDRDCSQGFSAADRAAAKAKLGIK